MSTARKSGKRWTMREDIFIHTHHKIGMDFIGEHDLGRPKGSVARRIRYLKERGAWDALDRSKQAADDYRKAVGLGSPDEDEEV